MKRLLLAALVCAMAIGASAQVTVDEGVPTQTGGFGISKALADAMYCQLSGGVGCTMAGAILGANGSGAVPSHSFANFPTFGLYAESGFFDATAGESAFRVVAQTAPPGALTTALVVAGGNIDAGSHSYKVTFVTATGETEGGTTSNAVTNDGTHAQNTLTVVPTGPAGLVTQRKIYRNKVADQTHWFLQQTIADNTTATGVQDNTADAGLGAAMPTTNSTIDARMTIANNGMVTLGDGAVGVPTIANATRTTDGMYFTNTSAGRVSFAVTGAQTFAIGQGTVWLGLAPNLGGTASSPNTQISGPAAATFQFGTNAASPVAQTLNGAPSSRAGTDTDVAGASFTIKSGTGTGLGAGEQTNISRGLMGTTGSAAHATANAFTVCESKTLSNTSATATTFATIGLASNSAGGMHALITVTATDGTNFDSETQDVTVSFVNKAGVITIGTPLISTSTAANNSGSATIGATVTGASPTISLKVTPVFTTIVPTTVTVYAEIFSHGAGAVTCQ